MEEGAQWTQILIQMEFSLLLAQRTFPWRVRSLGAIGLANCIALVESYPFYFLCFATKTRNIMEVGVDILKSSFDKRIRFIVVCFILLDCQSVVCKFSPKKSTCRRYCQVSPPKLAWYWLIWCRDLLGRTVVLITKQAIMLVTDLITGTIEILATVQVFSLFFLFWIV